jgi:hypothetical protein
MQNNDNIQKFINYIDWKKSYSFKHIICFGKSNNLTDCIYGHENVNGGTHLNLTDTNFNTIDKICNKFYSEHILYQTILPKYTNLFANCFNILFGFECRYDIYFLSKCRIDELKNYNKQKTGLAKFMSVLFDPKID